MGTAERKERERNRRQNDILDAAEEVFFAKGLNEATMDEVAERAELSKGTLYLYFKSKEAVYIGISLRATTLLKAKLEEAVRTHDNDGDRLMAIVSACFRFASDHPVHFRIMSLVDGLLPSQDNSGGIDPLMEQCHRARTDLLDLMAEVVKNGQDQGLLFSELDPTKTALLIWSAGNGVIQLNQNEGTQLANAYDLDKGFLFEEFMRFCVRALFVNLPEGP